MGGQMSWPPGAAKGGRHVISASRKAPSFPELS